MRTSRLRIVDSSKTVPHRFAKAAILLCLLADLSGLVPCHGDLPAGDEDSAKDYYRRLSKTLEFPTPDLIFQTKLDDVATYFGYDGLSGQDMQNIPSTMLMGLQRTLADASVPAVA